jgi:hypothetical protein
MGNSWPVIARTAPGYGSIATIDETKREFSEQSPLFSVPTFPKPNTPSGAGVDHGSQLLPTRRSRVQRGEELRGKPHRDTILMNPADLKRSGLRGQVVADHVG